MSHETRFDPVVDLLEQHVGEGVERGASLCVVQDGEVVLDVWRGSSDLEGAVPWDRDTLVPVWSITKTMTALCALVLVDRGLVDVEAPVATYWPEFAAAGKESVTVAHLLSHASGVSGWDQPVSADDIFDVERSTARLAAQAPWWEPGTASGYHLLNQGHLVGEVVRRVTGDSLGTFFAREIAEPLGADFHLGLAPEHDARVSPLTSPRLPDDLDQTGLTPESVALRTMTGPFLSAREANTERWRRAELGALTGIGNARSVARVQSVMSHGGEVDGVRLLSPDTVDRAIESRVEGTDLVHRAPVRYGLGWALPLPATYPFVPQERVCFWGGFGGSVVINDLDRRVTIAYTPNRLVLETIPGQGVIRPVGDARATGYLAAIEQAL